MKEQLQSQFVNMNQARLAPQVLSLAIVATLATFMYRTILKRKHYFYEQQPHSQGQASTEGVTGPMPKRLRLLQLLELTHTDDLDAMVCNCVTQSCRHESCCWHSEAAMCLWPLEKHSLISATLGLLEGKVCAGLQFFRIKAALDVWLCQV